ncbi:MAG: RHS repeat-associated core domain-containing protein [Actinobacteria bacterium]|nr:RHS repeat-associated core domain-containing protein [Actinomycetota bacterium]
MVERCPFISDPSGTRLAQTDHTKDPGERTHPFRSPRGDVLALLDRDGNPTRTYAYSPYGETEEGYAEEGTPFLFQDDYLDPGTSLYHMQARWYDPASSSFLSPDPEMGEASDPQARLPYAYCGGDPVYNSDPEGKTPRDLALAMRNPALAGMIMKNRALMLAILLKPGSGRKGSFLGGLLGNRRRAEEKAERSGWPLIDVKPRTQEQLNAPFIPNEIAGRFGKAELSFIWMWALGTGRGERLDPFLKLLGVEKEGGETIPEFLANIAGGKGTFLNRVRVNFTMLSFQEKILVSSFYNPMTQELDIEKFGAITEFCMMREVYDIKQLTEESWAGRTPVLGWLFRKAMTPARWVESTLTHRAVNITYGPTTLRKMMQAAQLLNYAVVEKDRWEEAAAQISTLGDSPSTGGVLFNDPVYRRFENTVLSVTADWASELFKVFYKEGKLD